MGCVFHGEQGAACRGGCREELAGRTASSLGRRHSGEHTVKGCCNAAKGWEWVLVLGPGQSQLSRNPGVGLGQEDPG